MPRPTPWLVGWLVVRLTLAPAPRPAAWATSPADAGSLPAAGALLPCIPPDALDPPVGLPLAPSAFRPVAARLPRDPGISSTGSDPAALAAALPRLRRSPALRAAFRAAHGDAAADRLERLLDRRDLSDPRALVVGGSVVIPNIAPAPPRRPGEPLHRPALVKSPRVLSLAEYESRLAAELEALEADRLRYLESASEAARVAASVRGFAHALLRPGGEDVRTQVAARAAGDHSALLARMRTLRLELGADSSLRAAAWARVEEASRAGRACQEQARRHLRAIHLGAGGVVGLLGAAGVVVASGATGTLGGGLVIAAAIEASLGAYLVYRTERAGRSPAAEEEREAREPELPEAERRRFRPEDGEEALDRGREGDGQGEWEMAYDGEPAAGWEGGEGEGEEDEQEGDPDPGPREDHIPPVLPPDLPEELARLPSLLDLEAAPEARSASLAEARQRLDEFLALEAPSPSERPEPPLRSATVEELIAEAEAALGLWVERRELSPGFGEFFLRAELEEAPASRRAEVAARAGARFAADRAAYEGSVGLEELRRRIAGRLVTHCRAEATRGDLVQAACSDETALAILVIAAVRHSGAALPAGGVLGVQTLGGDFHPVVFFERSREVLSLTSGERVRGVAGPLYHPASFYYGFLVEHGVKPDIDAERHLLIAPADPGAAQPEGGCADPERRGVVERVVDWLRSVVGADVPSRRGRRCTESLTGSGGGETEPGAAGERRGVSVSVSGPRLPSPRSGGGPGGGGGAGGGGAGGGDARGSTGGGGQQGEGGEAEAGVGSRGGQAARGGAGTGGDDGAGGAGEGGGAAREGAGGEGGGAAGSGEGGAGMAGVDLAEIARETIEMRERHESAGPLRVRPWRLRADYGYTAPSARVLFADNELALSRFEADEPFITLSPSEDEAQRRMMEADSFPVFPVGSDCTTDGLPPRRVFRRAADGAPGFRYVFCDRDESMVIFRAQTDARSYASLGAPDRPLLLVRLASERLERLEGSEEIARIRAFLADPEVLRGYSPGQVDSMAQAAGALLVFQQTLESALAQSMEELDGPGVRAHYYELHRQVMEGPLFASVAEAARRMNRRLASDPLQSLSWADALPPETRQGFFRLHYLLGGTVHWTDRWEMLRGRYTGAPAPAREPASGPTPSLDFLRVLADPTRVRIDWRAEPRAERPSIRDRKVQAGRERSPEERPEPTEAEEREREEQKVRKRGGTRGQGSTGEGEGAGPERGRRPLQMIRIRLAPETGEPDRPRMPADNPTRPGGTRGKRKSAEESATRQEPVLWVSPTTFADALLSAWDRSDPGPAAAGRAPVVLRFDARLRRHFLRELDRGDLYDGRILGLTGAFTSGGWLRYEEARAAMGGPWVRVRAHDTGRFAAMYARTVPITDQDQVRTPNFFTGAGIVIPADLLEPLRRRYTRGGNAIFDLAAEPEAGEPLRIGELPFAPGDPEGAARESLVRSLRLIAEQARERD